MTPNSDFLFAGDGKGNLIQFGILGNKRDQFVTLEKKKEFGGSGNSFRIDSWAFTADGMLMATADLGGKLQIWDVQNGQSIYENQEPLEGRIWCVNIFAVSAPNLIRN